MGNREDMLRSVAAILAARGRYGTRERRLLEWLRDKWHMDPARFELLLSEAAEHENVVVPDAPRATRLEWFHGLTSAVAVDGIVSPQEWTMLRAVAERVGLSSAEIVASLETALRRGSPPPAPDAGSVQDTTVAVTAWPGPLIRQEEVPYPTEESVPTEWREGDVFLELYEVRRVLGRGGVGTVFLVHHREWDLDLAVKCPRPEILRFEGAREHIMREAETWINLGLHPHTASCFYVRVLGGLPRVFAEYVDGGSLADLIRSRELYAGGPEKALERILDVSIQFAWGLDFAHAQGLVHGDVKPGNLLVSRQGQAKVTDFGLAKAADRPAEADRTWSGLTPAYASPEQAENQVLTRASDLWSWAVSVLEMFAGEVTWHRGHQADDALQRYLAHGTVEHDLPRMPRPVADLLFRCLRRDPRHRPASMKEVADELREIHRLVLDGRPHARAEPRPTVHLADGLNNRAVSLFDLERNEDAQRLLEQALDADPHHIHASYHRGLLLWRTGRITDDSLVRTLREVQKTHTRSYEDELLLGWVHIERGEPEAASFVIETAERLAGDDAIARRAIALARAAAGPAFRCTKALEGHTDEVHALARMPDGETALSASWDRTLRVWDLVRGTCLRVLEGHEAAVNDVAVTADGRWAVSAGADGNVRVWDPAQGRCLRTLAGPGDAIDAIGLTPDGRYALSSAEDRSLSLWDLGSGRHLTRWEHPGGPATALAFTRDGKRAISADADGSLRVWEVPTGRILKVLSGHARGVEAVAWTSDGDLAVSAGHDRTVRVWHVGRGQCLRVMEGHQDGVSSLDLTADGLRAVTGSWDGTLRVWDVPLGRCLRTLEGHGGAVTATVLSRDGLQAISAGRDGTVRVWELPRTTPAAPAQLVRPQRIEEVMLRQDRFALEARGAEEALARGDAAQAVEHLTAARMVPGFERSPEAMALATRAARCAGRGAFAGAWVTAELAGHADGLWDVAVTPDGRRAVSGGKDGTVRVWDLDAEACIAALEGPRTEVNGVAITADGRRALWVSPGLAVQVWDLALGKLAHVLTGAGQAVDGLAVTPDGRLAASCGGGSVRVWSLDTGLCLWTLERMEEGLNALALAPDGSWALAGGIGCEVIAWDLPAARRPRVFAGHDRPLTAVAATPDLATIVSASLDGTVRVWDGRVGRHVRTLEGHEGAVEAVALTPDGRVVLSGGADGAVCLWDVGTGKLLRTLEGHTSAVEGVALTPEGRRAVSVGEDRIVRVWTIDWELVV